MRKRVWKGWCASLACAAALAASGAAGFGAEALLAQAGGKPFCLIAGAYDTAASGACMRRVAAYRANPDAFLFIHHGRGHRPPPEATEEGYRFLDRYLRPLGADRP